MYRYVIPCPAPKKLGPAQQPPTESETQPGPALAGSPSARDSDYTDVASYIEKISDDEKFNLLERHFQPHCQCKFPRAESGRTFQRRWLHKYQPKYDMHSNTKQEEQTKLKFFKFSQGRPVGPLSHLCVCVCGGCHAHFITLSLLVSNSLVVISGYAPVVAGIFICKIEQKVSTESRL